MAAIKFGFSFKANQAVVVAVVAVVANVVVVAAANAVSNVVGW